MPVRRGTTEEDFQRLSIGLTPAQREGIQKIADTNGVSVAWVIRYACEKLIREFSDRQLPLQL